MTGAGELAVEALRYRYRKSSEILYGGLSHEFTPGAMTALTGPSGAGKSTLLYLLGLLLHPQHGRVLLDGTDLTNLPDARRSVIRAQEIGFVFQDAALDTTRSVLDNVTEGALYARIPRQEARRRALELLDRFGVELRANYLPGQISGGQAQRVALCRALLNRPRVLLADEPTGNLDTAATEVVLGAFRELADSGVTVLVATHDHSVTRRCDDVLSV